MSLPKEAYQEHAEILWNPYIFGGMPNYLISSNLKVDWIQQVMASGFWVFSVVFVGYFCLRFNPGKIEKKTWEFLSGDIDGLPNIIIILLVLNSGWVVLRIVWMFIFI